jgi:hypothetical protein
MEDFMIVSAPVASVITKQLESVAKSNATVVKAQIIQ